jgi:hypothetical protein
MVSLFKTESHQVDVNYKVELDLELLSEIYPDLNADELKRRLDLIESGAFAIETLIDDAYQGEIVIEWDEVGQDNWTARKGGFNVTYSLDSKPSDRDEV